MSDDPWTITDEIPHSHYCAICGAVWTHEDEGCEGPRYRVRHPIVGDWDCPACEGATS